MTVAELLVIAAVVASVVLLARSSARLWPGLALAASGLEALLMWGIVSLSVSGVNLWLILAAALVVSGGAAWLAGGARLNVTASVVLVAVGGVQIAQILST